ncbi:hypothetical protein FUAX_15180 [Fulvitalea axinellae]|uniref:Mucoidy inhibitor MuiA family protein n=1 Tax=Fulvitalea axinellae TaxID=1182444 RepID=A0AAU9D875_9BACT|nr:hypothetical protein FUAX_15180 [Fulvitalea axinellae]
MRTSRIFIALALAYLPFSTFGQTKTQNIKSKIKDVTVFLSGAQIYREAKVTCPPGKRTLVFDNLPASLRPKSVQVGGQGDFTILSVNFNKNYLATPKPENKTRELKAKAKKLEYRIEETEAKIKAFGDEHQLLTANRNLGGKDSGLDINQLKAAADFYRTRLNEILQSTIQLKQQVKTDRDQLRRIKNELAKLHGPAGKSVGQVLVTVTSKRGFSTKMALGYFIDGAGWTPRYDARVASLNKPLRLSYKADIFQMTGEKWERVRLSVSSANPDMSGQLPELHPWYIRQSSPQLFQSLQDKVAGVQISEMADDEDIDFEMEVEDEDDSETMFQYDSKRGPKTTAIRTSGAVRFDIEEPYTLESDGENRTVTLARHKLQADYSHHCVPKLNTAVFLTADLTGWESLDLLSGEMSLYYEGMYVGDSELNTNIATDTLRLSLGQDRGVVVERVKKKAFSKNQTLSNARKQSAGWEILIRNNKKTPVNLTVTDQWPVSRRNNISVKLLQAQGASKNEDNGKLTWKLKLKPMAKKTLFFAYEVKAPKNITVQMQ